MEIPEWGYAGPPTAIEAYLGNRLRGQLRMKGLRGESGREDETALVYILRLMMHLLLLYYSNWVL